MPGLCLMGATHENPIFTGDLDLALPGHCMTPINAMHTADLMTDLMRSGVNQLYNCDRGCYRQYSDSSIYMFSGCEAPTL